MQAPPADAMLMSGACCVLSWLGTAASGAALRTLPAVFRASANARPACKCSSHGLRLQVVATGAQSAVVAQPDALGR